MAKVSVIVVNYNGKGIIEAGRNGVTGAKGVFAGGDIVGGEGTVIEAMGMAKKAASAMLDFLDKGKA